MRILPFLAAAVLAALVALPAGAEGVKLYPYATSVNYCPSGLQPIVLNGVICCGQPNTSMSYQQVKRHPVQRASFARRSNCPEGEKGCS